MITAERVRELLRYDPATGVVTWRVDGSSRNPAGSVAGYTDSQGYRRITIDRKAFPAHRLVWLLVTGTSPVAEIDHKDGNPSNNCWVNLREATRNQNTANTRLRTGKTLPKGVSYRASSGRYLAQIVHKRRTIYLGSFGSSQEAHAVYMVAARDLHGEFARAS